MSESEFNNKQIIYSPLEQEKCLRMKKTYVIYPFECLFDFLFLVQCVNAKAMSWRSMVEYRDLCKLFFKLKIKEIDITLIQIVVY